MALGPGLAGDAVSGLNSTIYYIVIGWLPLILTDAGLSAEQAGSLHGVMQLATAIPGLLLGPVLRRLQDQRWAAASVAALSGVALMGFQLAPQFAFAWATLFGLGAGAHFILGLAFIGMRTQNAHQAASLSGMAQCVGYLLAAVGPMAAGWLHDLLGGWQIPLLACAALASPPPWWVSLRDATYTPTRDARSRHVMHAHARTSHDGGGPRAVPANGRNERRTACKSLAAAMDRSTPATVEWVTGVLFAA
jgi:hypothetical protein